MCSEFQRLGKKLVVQEACKGLLQAWESRLVDCCWFVLLGEVLSFVLCLKIENPRLLICESENLEV